MKVSNGVSIEVVQFAFSAGNRGYRVEYLDWLC
jgi:hypothetical protein